MKRSFLLLAILLLVAITAMADDTVTEKETNTKFEKKIGESKELSLMGVAPRTKWFFKVYGVGLYADPVMINAVLGDGPTNEVRLAAAVMATSGKRALVLKFVRDLDQGKMVGAFKEGIERTIKLDNPKIKDDAAKLLAAFTPVKNGDVATLMFEGNKVSLLANGKSKVTVDNRTLSRALLAIYIGSNPIDAGIKSKLLKNRPE
jgi:hypothetical protein